MKAQPQASLLTVKQTAIRLGCSQANVYTLLEDGELPFVLIGKAKGYRIDPVDLDAFILQRKVQNRTDAKQTASRPKLKHIKLPK